MNGMVVSLSRVDYFPRASDVWFHLYQSFCHKKKKKSTSFDQCQCLFIPGHSPSVGLVSMLRSEEKCCALWNARSSFFPSHLSPASISAQNLSVWQSSNRNPHCCQSSLLNLFTSHQLVRNTGELDIFTMRWVYRVFRLTVALQSFTV